MTVAANRVGVRLLVAHTSHLTQPLDLGIFARCKALMKSYQTYVINLHRLYDVLLEDIDVSRRRRRVGLEPGKLLAEFILQILKVFHEATSPMSWMSAFEQAGVCSRSDRPDTFMVHHKAVVDQTEQDWSSKNWNSSSTTCRSLNNATLNSELMT